LLNRWFPNWGRVVETIDQGNAKLTFSQFGEDQMVWERFQNKRNGFYVDVGCHHPFRYSNTALLSNFLDWRGINIDPDARAIAQFQEHRPNDINLLCAVDREAGETEMFFFEDGAINSLDPDMAAAQTKQYGTPRRERVPVLRLRDVLDLHLPKDVQIDYMNIDCEARDHAVLESNDWEKYRPRLLSVEVHGFDPGHPGGNPTFQFLEAQGYIFFAQYYATSFYEIRG